jgi:hypothetical protein
MDVGDLIGQTLDGKYLIERQLGAGGMGTVFCATHLGTERSVALKIIAPGLMDDNRVLERFKREARAAGRLQHPNVVNVTDFGIAQLEGAGVAYLAMEYLQGFTLGELLQRQGKIPLSVAIDILEQVAMAVDQAHRLGIVHRDLKPANIWLAPDGRGGYQVKVLDFGIAVFRESALAESRAAAEEKAEQIRITSATTAVAAPALTHAGAMIGTPAYMSPEQCSGNSVTSRSDIYSLGVIAYEMITGELPFSGNTFELIAKHVVAIPPCPARVPKAVAATVLAALAKQPENRPVSAMAFAGALRAQSEGATMVLRRAVALWSMRIGELTRLSLLAVAPGLVCLIIAVATIFIHSLPWIVSILMTVFSLLLFSVGGVILSGLVFIWTDHVRRSPFDVLSTAKTVQLLGQRLPKQPHTTALNLYWRGLRLVGSNMRASLRTPNADSALTFFALIESSCDVERAVADARQLTGVLQKSLRIIDAVIVAFVAPGLLVLPALAIWSHGAGMRIGDPVHTLTIAAVAVCIVFPIALPLLAPLPTLAKAILYFRARQARGEDVAFSPDVMRF